MIRFHSKTVFQTLFRALEAHRFPKHRSTAIQPWAASSISVEAPGMSGSRVRRHEAVSGNHRQIAGDDKAPSIPGSINQAIFHWHRTVSRLHSLSFLSRLGAAATLGRKPAGRLLETGEYVPFLAWSQFYANSFQRLAGGLRFLPLNSTASTITTVIAQIAEMIKVTWSRSKSSKNKPNRCMMFISQDPGGGCSKTGEFP
jgi:hypothetical protein